VSPERLAELFDSNHRGLYRLARRLSADSEEARDLVQETFLRAARRLPLVPSAPDAEERWLVRTLVNLCRDRRRRLRVRDRFKAVLPVHAAAPDEGVSRAEARSMVQSALARLGARSRAIVILRELEGLEIAEIARMLGIARVTVRWHLARARRELRRMLLPADSSPCGAAGENTRKSHERR